MGDNVWERSYNLVPTVPPVSCYKFYVTQTLHNGYPLRKKFRNIGLYKSLRTVWRKRNQGAG